MEDLPTRYLAATFDVAKQTCETVLSSFLDADTLTKACTALPFDKLDTMKVWILAPQGDDYKQALLTAAGITEDDYAKIYDAAVDTSLAAKITANDQLISTTYGCPDVCTLDFLTLTQWIDGSITETFPEDLSGTKFIGTPSRCVTEIWEFSVFDCPEMFHYAPANYKDIGLEQASLLFDKTRGISLDNSNNAAIVASFIKSN